MKRPTKEEIYAIFGTDSDEEEELKHSKPDEEEELNHSKPDEDEELKHSKPDEEEPFFDSDEDLGRGMIEEKHRMRSPGRKARLISEMPLNEVTHVKRAEAATVTYWTRHDVSAEFTEEEKEVTASIFSRRGKDPKLEATEPRLYRRSKEAHMFPPSYRRIMAGGRFMPEGHVLVFTTAHSAYVHALGESEIHAKGAADELTTHKRKNIDYFKPGCTGVYISATSNGVCNMGHPSISSVYIQQLVRDVENGKTPLRAAYIAMLRLNVENKHAIASYEVKKPAVFKHYEMDYRRFLGDRPGGPPVIASIFEADTDLPNKFFSKRGDDGFEFGNHVGLVNFDMFGTEDFPFYLDFIEMGITTTQEIFAELRRRGATHIIFADESCNYLGPNKLLETGEDAPPTDAQITNSHLHEGLPLNGGTRKNFK